MGQTLTYLTELAVGLGCILAAVAMARTPRTRWLALVLVAAGAAAIVHAVSRLVV